MANKYGYYKSFRGLKAAIEEGRADFYINRYFVFATCLISKSKVLLWFEFALRAIIPAIAIILFNSLYVHSKWFWIPLIIHVVLAIAMDTGEMFVFIAVLGSVFGIFRHHPFVILCTAPFIATYLATALSWKCMNETLKKDSLVDAETFGKYWDNELIMVRVGQVLYSSKKEATLKQQPQKKATRDSKGRPIKRVEPKEDKKTQRQREEEYQKQVAAYKESVEHKKERDKAAKEARKAEKKAAKENKDK